VPIFSEFVYTGFATSRQWAQDNPEPARAFSRALNTAMERVSADPAAAATEIVDRMSADNVAIIQQTLNALTPALSRNGCFEAGAVRTTLATMHDVEITTSAGDPAEGMLWTTTYNSC
jgi:NitT/TauT family transport system substrate-binding protein